MSNSNSLLMMLTYRLNLISRLGGVSRRLVEFAETTPFYIRFAFFFERDDLGAWLLKHMGPTSEANTLRKLCKLHSSDFVHPGLAGAQIISSRLLNLSSASHFLLVILCNL